jgi:hypothetical protein
MSSLGLFYEIWVWVILECDLAIICASVPPLRPFFRKYLPIIMSKLSMSMPLPHIERKIRHIKPLSTTDISITEDLTMQALPRKYSEDMEKGVREESKAES